VPLPGPDRPRSSGRCPDWRFKPNPNGPYQTGQVVDLTSAVRRWMKTVARVEIDRIAPLMDSLSVKMA